MNTRFIDFETNSGLYRAEVVIKEVCIRRGSFSSAALDPEEYNGIFEYRLDDICWVEDEFGEIVDITDEIEDTINEYIEELN